MGSRCSLTERLTVNRKCTGSDWACARMSPAKKTSAANCTPGAGGPRPPSYQGGRARAGVRDAHHRFHHFAGVNRPVAVAPGRGRSSAGDRMGTCESRRAVRDRVEGKGRLADHAAAAVFGARPQGHGGYSRTCARGAGPPPHSGWPPPPDRPPARGERPASAPGLSSGKLRLSPKTGAGPGFATPAGDGDRLTDLHVAFALPSNSAAAFAGHQVPSLAAAGLGSRPESPCRRRCVGREATRRGPECGWSPGGRRSRAFPGRQSSPPPFRRASPQRR